MPALFEDLRERLLAAGIGPARVGRYLRELDDHFEDLVDAMLIEGASVDEARMASLRLMGTPETLAQAMLARPELRSWLAQAPWLVLPAGALLSLAAGYVPSLLFLLGAVKFFGIAAEGHLMPPAWLPGSAEPLFGFDHVALPVLIGWGIAFAASRQRLPLLWPLISIIAIALLGAGIVFAADWPTTPRQWAICFGTPLVYPDLPMDWADYGWSTLIILVLTVVPTCIAVRFRHNGETHCV